MKPRFNYFKAPDIGKEESRHILFYCEWGDPNNKDIIVCAHGLTRNSRDFDYLAQALADKYRVICIDVVGRGKSEWLSNKSLYDYTTYVTDATNLLNHLGIKSVNWVGTSMGGIIGMILASNQPDIIKNLVLNDIGSIIPGAAIERILNYASATYEFHSKSDAENALRSRMSTFGVAKEDYWLHIFKHSIIKKLNDKYTFAYDPGIIPKAKLLNRLKRIASKVIHRGKKAIFNDVNLTDIWNKVTCPTLIVRGTKSDVLTKEIAESMQAGKENVEIIEFENVGHAPMLMEENQISDVREWLLKNK